MRPLKDTKKERDEINKRNKNAAANKPVGSAGAVEGLALGGSAVQDDFALYFFGVHDASTLPQRISERLSDA